MSGILYNVKIFMEKFETQKGSAEKNEFTGEELQRIEELKKGAENFEKNKALDSISRSSSFDELKEIIEVLGGIEGRGGKFHSAEEINKVISGIEEIMASDRALGLFDMVKNGEASIILDQFTENAGLRKTVEKLILKEGDISKLNREIQKA